MTTSPFVAKLNFDADVEAFIIAADAARIAAERFATHAAEAAAVVATAIADDIDARFTKIDGREG